MSRGFAPIQETANRQRRSQPSNAAEAILLSVVDWGLAAVILVAPWFMGGRHPLGELVLVLLAVLVAIAWCARQIVMRGEPHWIRSPASLMLAAVLGLVLLQLAPLPQSILRVLSPAAADRLPLWQAGNEMLPAMDSWNQVTLTPDATLSALAMLLAYALLLLVTVQRIRRVEDVEAILQCLAISVSLLAAVAIVQYLAGNGKFLWVYQHPFRDTTDGVKGPFTNKNHFAHLLALGLGPLVWLVQRATSRGRRGSNVFGTADDAGPSNPLAITLPLVALVLVLFAGLMSLSRGGAVAMLTAAILSVAALAHARLLGKKLVLGLAAAIVLIAAALTIHGYQSVSTRLGDLVSGSAESLDKYGHRRTLWLADANGFKDFYPLGSGIGSHRDVYPMYFDMPLDVELTHAESGPLQITLEAGAPGLVLMLTSVAICASWCLGAIVRPRSQRTFLCAAAVSASLAASVVHSLVDFVWYIPSLMAITTLLVGCAVRLWQLGRDSIETEKQKPLAVTRAMCAAAAGCIALAGAWMIGNRFCAAMASSHWDQYLTYALARDETTGRALPPDQSVFDHLQAVVYWTPRDARAHLRLAQACLRRFDQLQETAQNAMPLSQIRDAAVQSAFNSRAALDDWLSRAVGPPRGYLDLALWHTRRSATLCPLLGEAYVNLGDLCFLEGAPAGAKAACLAQALKVRPHNGEVLLAAGSDAALSGDLEQAVGYWRGALEKSQLVQAALTDLLVAYRISPEVVITTFQPRLPVVRLLAAKYTAVGLPAEGLRPLLEYYGRVGRTEAADRNDPQAAGLWLELHGVYRQLNEPQKMFDCLQRALAVSPNSYDAHYALGMCLFEHRHFDEAHGHLSWCLHRRPDDAHLQQMFARAVNERVARSPSPTNAQRGTSR